MGRQGAVPRNGHEVAREFKKRQTPTEKITWLSSIPEESYAGIFHVEIDAELLQSILGATHAVLSQGNTENSQDEKSMPDASQKILLALAKHCEKPLSFALSFAASSERKRVEEIVGLLEKQGSCVLKISKPLRVLFMEILTTEA